MDDEEVVKVIKEEYEKKLEEQRKQLTEEYEQKMKQEHDKNIEYIRTIIQGRKEPDDATDEYDEEMDIEKIANKILKEFK